MKSTSLRRRRRPVLAAGVCFLCLGFAPPPPGSRPAPDAGSGVVAGSGRGAAPDPAAAAERGRNPLGLVRTATRPRVWVLLDTSTSMENALGHQTRFQAARQVIRTVARRLESDDGEPLVHWRLASFLPFRPAADERPATRACSDPTMGAGLPPGSPPGPPVSRVLRCGGLSVLSDPPGCDPEQARRRLLRSLPGRVNSERTPNGIALHQLAARIAANSLADLGPGQKNIIVLITDGDDSCECSRNPWLDFHEGPPGRGSAAEVWLRAGGASPEPVRFPNPSAGPISAFNAGLKAKAAYRRLNGGDPDAGLGDIHVVGVAMADPRVRAYTNHIAWMASGLRHSAVHVDRPETLLEALTEVLDEATLPAGEAKVAAPRLATVKELVAGSPSPDFAGSDPSLDRDALVADPADKKELHRVLRLRSSYADNVLVSSGAELERLRGHLRAYPAAAGTLSGPPIWDAGARLARRDPADRVILFNRPGSTVLRSFEVGVVTAADLGVAAGYLREFDGAGARTAADAAEIVVRLVRGEDLRLHPGTKTIYDPAGSLHFSRRRGVWKLREGLAAPAVVTSPPGHPERALRQRDAYLRFFGRQVNRRTMVYLPTSGGLLHAFAGDSGEEVFAYIPDDVLGPAPGAGASGGPFLRELAFAGLPDTSGLRRGLWNRFALAGAPVARDAFFPGRGEWRTVLSFGRFVGGRFLTALDVTEVGGRWSGGHDPPRPSPKSLPGGAGLPRLLFNNGSGPGGSGPALAGLGETPEPLIAEVPAGKGSEWVLLVPGGAGSAGDDSGEWLFALALADGRLRSRFRLPRAPSAAIGKNGAVTPAAPWRPVWGSSGASDLITRVYVGDLHGQVHRLDLSKPGAWDWRVAHRLGGDQPILTPMVAFPFPGRTEPHLLVVTGGDRRVRSAASQLVLLRDLGGRLEEVWRRPLDKGESPQGKPVVLTGKAGIEVVLATRAQDLEVRSCGAVETSDGVSRLRAFHGITGAPLPGVVHSSKSSVAFGPGRIRGVSLSSGGNIALSVSSVAGEALDTLIGDFKFRVRDGALEPVTLFVEGFRRSPF